MDSLPSQSKAQTSKKNLIQRIQSPKFIPMNDISTWSFQISLGLSDLDLQEVNVFFK